MDQPPVTGQDNSPKYEIIEKKLNRDHIMKFRLKEDWIFDKQLSSLYVRILGIAPILAKYDENGNKI